MPEAETRLLEAGRAVDGPSVSPLLAEQIGEQPLPTGKVASTEQVAAVGRLACSGRALDLLVGAAGTGKSTTMAALRTAWEGEHGPGSVLGLAPSAAAAQVLADAVAIPAENTAKWLTEHARNTDRLTRLG
ncbi:MAG TPA: AAA family ATPase, partial [Segeticoccus sp.]|nr:AAA family ATPase [Segeticoccus sp.]